MKYKLTEKCYKKDLKIPKGYRLIEDYELLKLLREDKKIKKLLNDGWIWCNTYLGCGAASLNYYDVSFRIVGYYILDYSDGCSRGVLIKK